MQNLEYCESLFSIIIQVYGKNLRREVNFHILLNTLEKSIHWRIIFRKKHNIPNIPNIPNIQKLFLVIIQVYGENNSSE